MELILDDKSRAAQGMRFIHVVSQIHRVIENSELHFFTDDEIRKLARQKPPTADSRAEAKHHVY